jgi:hypothetical protein
MFASWWLLNADSPLLLYASLSLPGTPSLMLQTSSTFPAPRWSVLTQRTCCCVHHTMCSVSTNQTVHAHHLHTPCTPHSTCAHPVLKLIALDTPATRSRPQYILYVHRHHVHTLCTHCPLADRRIHKPGTPRPIHSESIFPLGSLLHPWLTPTPILIGRYMAAAVAQPGQVTGDDPSEFPSGPVVNLAPIQFSKDPTRPFPFSDPRAVEGAKDLVPGAGVGEAGGASGVPAGAPDADIGVYSGTSLTASLLGPPVELDGACRRCLVAVFGMTCTCHCNCLSGGIFPAIRSTYMPICVCM